MSYLDNDDDLPAVPGNPFLALQEANFVVDQDNRQAMRSMNRGVTPEFYVDFVPNPKKSEEAGRPMFDQVELVRIRVAGDVHNEHVAPVDAGVIARFPREYRAYKDGRKERLISGTPLRAWPPITPLKIKELEALNIFSVEDLAQIPDTSLGHHMHDLRDWRTKAQAWLDQAADGATVMKIASENERLKVELADTRKQMADLAKRFDIVQEEMTRRLELALRPVGAPTPPPPAA
jgi:hypothetical protein